MTIDMPTNRPTKSSLRLLLFTNGYYQLLETISLFAKNNCSTTVL